MPHSRRDSIAWPQPAVAWELLPSPQPELLTFPTGKDAKAQVEPGQSVKIGQLLVQGALPVYSPVSGTVLDADSTLVCVKNDYEDLALPCTPNPVLDGLSNEQIFAAIEHSGAASACGIPTSHTLRGLSSAPKQIVISCLDGSCLGMSQAFTMYHRGEQVLGGLRILMRLLGAPCGTILVSADQKASPGQGAAASARRQHHHHAPGAAPLSGPAGGHAFKAVPPDAGHSAAALGPGGRGNLMTASISLRLC